MFGPEAQEGFSRERNSTRVEWERPLTSVPFIHDLAEQGVTVGKIRAVISADPLLPLLVCVCVRKREREKERQGLS